MDDFILPPRFDLASELSSHYFGLWMVYPDEFSPLVNKINGLNLHAHIGSEAAQQAVKQQASRSFATTTDGIAILNIEGPMMKRASSLSGGTSTLRLRQQLREARKDPDISGAILRADTPGGTSRGNQDLVEEIESFNKSKPIYGFVEDMTASAGVSVLSATRKIFANNATAAYGAMGTYAVLVDQSGAAEKLGLKVHVVKAGEYKGMGEPGSELTEEQLQEAQRIVNTLNDSYLSMIARGRSMSVDQVRDMADGRIIFASDAEKAGLIDGVTSFDIAMAELRNEIGSTKQTTFLPVTNSLETSNTSEENTMEPATLAELKKAFPKSTAEWRESQLEANATILDASQAYAGFVQAQLDESSEKHKAELEAAKAESTKKTGSLGFSPLTIGSVTGDEAEPENAIEAFELAVLTHQNRYKSDRQTAVSAIRRSNPNLAHAYLIATNPGMRAQRELQERFDGMSKLTA